MPKVGNTLSLEYLASPTPARALEASPLLVPEETSEQCPPTPKAPVSPDDMDIFDAMESTKGLDASMHAPDTQILTSEPLVPAQPSHDDDDDEAFLKELAAVTELSSKSATAPSRPPNLHFTLPPSEGFPITYRGLAAEFMVNLAPTTVIAWRAIADPKFFVRFYDYDGKDGASKHQTLVLKLQKSLEIIASHVGTSTAALRISPPVAQTPALPDAAPPTTFIVYGVSKLLRNTVVDQRIWSVPQVTFEAYPFESNVIPSIVLCLSGFICPDNNTVTDAVMTAWLQPLTKAQLVEILLSLDPSFKGEGTRHAQKAIQKMADSARSELLNFRTPGGAPSPRWNIYVSSPTSRIAAWTKIKEYVDELTYPSTLSGIGVTRKFFQCTLCYSYNHPRGLCPFPNIQGWSGPQHFERNSDPTEREYGRGRGRNWTGMGRQPDRARYQN